MNPTDKAFQNLNKVLVDMDQLRTAYKLIPRYVTDVGQYEAMCEQAFEDKRKEADHSITTLRLALQEMSL